MFVCVENASSSFGRWVGQVFLGNLLRVVFSPLALFRSRLEEFRGEGVVTFH